MNKRTEELYRNLMHLVNTNDAFYYVDHPINGCVYRVFTYRLASYTDFLLPDALECRGHMFRLDTDGNMEELVSAPFEKFFNLNENPMVMDINFDTIDFIHDKRDGSLISTFMHDGFVCLKSKTAIASDQALDATRLMHSDSKLHDIVQVLGEEGFTTIMEYTAPDNRIVLPYQEPELRILGVRNNVDLSYIDYDFLYKHYGDYMVDDHTNDFTGDPLVFLHDIPEMTGREGFVIGYNGGNRIKIKTLEYLSLHRAKDSINSNKRLFEVCLNDATDDLRSLFCDDPYTLNRITEMEQIVGQAYNGVVSSVEKFHKDNADLDRKSYAIRGQQELTKLEFGFAMMKFTGREPNYKEGIMKNFKLFVEDNDDT